MRPTHQQLCATLLVESTGTSGDSDDTSDASDSDESDDEGSAHPEGQALTTVATIAWLPDELLLAVFARVQPRELLVTIHAVCRRWRALLPDVVGVTTGHGVALDLRFSFSRRPRRPTDDTMLFAELAQRFRHVGSLYSGPILATDQRVADFAKHCPRLTVVDVGCATKLTDDGMASLVVQCPNITSIRLGNVLELTDASLVAIAKHCLLLTSIELGATVDGSQVGRLFLPDGGVTAFVKKSGRLLTVVHLATAQSRRHDLSSAVIDAISVHCPHIVSVSLAHCDSVTDETVVRLAKSCPRLVSVAFAYCCEVSEVSIQALADHCPRLHTVDFGDCPKTRLARAMVLAPHCPDLNTVSLFNYTLRFTRRAGDTPPRVTAAEIHTSTARAWGIDSVTVFIDECEHLALLTMHSENNLPRDALQRILVQCVHLQSIDMDESASQDLLAVIAALRAPLLSLTSLNVGYGTNSDKDLVTIAEKCPALTSVTATHCFDITDMGLISLACSCPHLTEIDLSGARHLTDTSIAILAERCPQLSAVSFGWCDRLTDASIAALATRCPNLASVVFIGCTKLSARGCSVLFEKCLLLKTVRGIPHPGSG
eukprot:m.226237 g.226237  ORF g.226237 m.226237 type:complete len:599 (-) comp25926_c0_seq1:337-2133(-)